MRPAAVLSLLAALAAFAAAPEPAPAATEITAAKKLEAAFLQRMNTVRQAHDRSPLRAAPRLNRAGRGHVVNMARHGYFAHRWSNGDPYGTWIRRYWPGPDYRSWSAGENLYWEGPSTTARRVGLTRGEFLRTAAGTATAFMVLNRLHGAESWGSNAALPVRKVHCEDVAAGRELLDRKMFVMDVQTHHLDLELTRATDICKALDFRGLAVSLGAKPSDVDCPERLGQLNFVKEVLVDSQTSVAVLSGVPNGVILGPDLVRRGDQWEAHPEESQDRAVRGVSAQEYLELAKKTYRLLMTRGMRSCRLYSTDTETQEFLTSLVSDAPR